MIFSILFTIEIVLIQAGPPTAAAAAAAMNATKGN